MFLSQGIFSRCLMTTLHVELWRLYLRYIRSTADPTTPEGAKATRQV